MKSAATITSSAFSIEIEVPHTVEDKRAQSHGDIPKYRQIQAKDSGMCPILTLAALRRKGGKVIGGILVSIHMVALFVASSSVDAKEMSSGEIKVTLANSLWRALGKDQCCTDEDQSTPRKGFMMQILEFPSASEFKLTTFVNDGKGEGVPHVESVKSGGFEVEDRVIDGVKHSRILLKVRTVRREAQNGKFDNFEENEELLFTILMDDELPRRFALVELSDPKNRCPKGQFVMTIYTRMK